MEDCIGLPSLPDLLNELDRDVDIESLEELTQSLLQDIAADLEVAAQKTNCQESELGGKNCIKQVVGSPSKNLESSRTDSLTPNKEDLEQEISHYLLLHHDYSAKQNTQKPITKHRTSQNTKKSKNDKKSTNLRTKTKLKPIMPKVTSKERNLETFSIDSNDSVENADVLYGTLDESTNCITIYVDDDSLYLSEAVTEVATSEDTNDIVSTEENDLKMQTLEFPALNKENMSGLSPAHSTSDCGYESLGSPHSTIGSEADLWDQSVSELFPMLL